MPEFSVDETRRWDAWQRANAISVRRSDQVARYVTAALFAAALLVLGIAIWG